MTTAQMYDRNMELARRLAEGLGPPPELPSSLQKIESRCQLVSAIDGPLVVRSTPEEGMEYLGRRIAKIAATAGQHMREVSDPLTCLNIALRLWSGCLSAAKTVAMETRSGPNTPELRQSAFASFDAIAHNDPIYKAGVEAAPAFKRLRNQPYSLEGVPETSPVRYFAA